MQDVACKFGCRCRQGLGHVPLVLILCLAVLAPAKAQAPAAGPDKAPGTRLLTVEEGRSIADTAIEEEQLERGTQDCSHVAHQIYSDAGFEYRYASSFELFAGHDNFTRVRYPRAGDLIVWPGHVGIVVDPVHHSFSSLVSTGLDVQDYESAYWRSRGIARFYRYKVQTTADLTATVAKNHAAPKISRASKAKGVPTLVEERSTEEVDAANRPPRPASERSVMIYGPAAPVEEMDTSTPFEMPSNVVVASAGKPPTREDVAEGISELNDAAASVFRSEDPFAARSPVVIVEQFSVTRLELKRDHGWAQLQVQSKVSIDRGTVQRKQLHENVRWELRHLPTGWEVVVPPDRTYVPHDVAVKNLAAQLAQLTQSNAASAHEVNVLRQESRIANLLGALLETK